MSVYRFALSCTRKKIFNVTFLDFGFPQTKVKYFPPSFTRLCHTEAEKDVVVYSGPLTRQIRSVKLFSLITSLAGLVSQPVIWEKSQQLQASSFLIAFTCGFVGFFTFVTPLLLHWVTKKYVTTVFYNSSENAYKAVTYTLFLRKKTINFKPGEAVIPSGPGMFTTFTVRGIPLFVDLRFFSDVNHYKKIMGFDKPMDFKLKLPSSM